MLRTLFVGVFLSIYILLVGPPLLVYTLVSRNPNPLYWAGINGVMFFVRAVGVRVRVVGTERIPAGDLFVCGESYEFGGCAGGGGGDSRGALRSC